jgi:hypothetical protein
MDDRARGAGMSTIGIDMVVAAQDDRNEEQRDQNDRAHELTRPKVRDHRRH